MLENRADMNDDPFMHAFSITRDMNKTMWTYMECVMRGDDFVADEIAQIKQKIETQPISATKFRTYCELNPTLETHPLYTKSAPIIPDYLRINFTRYRISSHRLRVEVGRWSRTPKAKEERVCSCGTGIQNEFHIFQCPLVDEILNGPSKSYSSPSDFFNDTTAEDLQILHKVLNKLYEVDEHPSDDSD